MNVKTFLKQLFVTASIYFMLITAVYTLIAMIVNVADDRVYLLASQMLFHFLFSLLASAAWQIFRFAKFGTAARVLTHYAILLFSFYLCFLVPAAMRAPQVVIGIILFSLVYLIIMALASLFTSRFRTNRDKEASYQKQFVKKK